MTYEELLEKNKDIIKCCVATGPGWFNIVDELCQNMRDAGYVGVYWAVQIKEKFGGLRFYTNFGCTELYDMIEEAEHKAERTCELTGKPGEIRCIGGWYSCLCDEEYEKAKSRLPA